MELIDASLRFASGLSITNSKISTVLDGKSVKEYARGQPLYVNIYLDTIFDAADDTLAVGLAASSGATPGAGDVFQTIMPARAASTMLTTGLLWRQALPQDIPYEQLGLYFTVTTTLSSGKITAFLSLGQDSDTKTTT